VQLALLPMFLFSTTFYPLSVYPRALQIVVECTPLYHGIELIRRLVTGDVAWSLLGHVAYLAVLGLIGLAIGARRLGNLLLK
jgi:lipooligosaccharide transport system permease protein